MLDDNSLSKTTTTTTTTPNNNIDSSIDVTSSTCVTAAGTTTTIPPPGISQQCNEKSNQTILLEKMEIRGGDNRTIDERKTYENLFTESSSQEICSSNKGDTGNCNVKSRGNEFVEGEEVARNVRQNDSETIVAGNDDDGIRDETNCD